MCSSGWICIWGILDVCGICSRCGLCGLCVEWVVVLWRMSFVRNVEWEWDFLCCVGGGDYGMGW